MNQSGMTNNSTKSTGQETILINDTNSPDNREPNNEN